MEENKCSILVTSCDKYEDAWTPFFGLFHVMWPDCPYHIYLNTETKDYISSKITVTSIHPQNPNDCKGNPLSWSARLKCALEQIESEYILFMLEDFFLMSPVKSNVISKCISYMDDNKDIVAFDFHSDPHTKEIFECFFAPVDKSYDYAVNTMTTLWRKEYLISLLRDESAWDFEFFATGRWRRSKNKYIFTYIGEAPIFDYEIKPKYGYGIFQGRWLWNNKQLFEKYGIEADFSKRPTLQYEELPDLEARQREKNWLWNDFKKAISSPYQMLHYLECTKNVTKDVVRRFWRKYFNR